MTINRVLVANRGEIASRVFRTCRRLGIDTVAIHSDADAALPYVREADYAVHLPGNTPAETYLRGDLVVAAAVKAGADAVHPGYGFLSENADFARAVLDAGLVWIGPSPEAIEKMGSKIEAKKIMEAAGVPVLAAPASPTEADLPLLVKASAGGGGRGMRIVRSLADLDGEIAKAQAEAESAFGDGTVFVEPYLERSRHVEVQVVGTAEGVLVFGERDCSLQRRHQKVVEEAPAPGLAEATRAALHDAARTAAAAIDYRGAGTVEFLLDAGPESGQGPTRFWFLEMNTRLQVEHPVTEFVFHVDLVEAQLAVAEGRVPAAPGSPRGHAVEVRLYAEDPAADYQPQSGTLAAFTFPESVRVDAGYESGSRVSTFYDAMLAKVIAYGDTREQAIRALAGALRRARIHGLVTNREQLVAVLRDPRFVAGEVSTAFLSDGPIGAAGALGAEKAPLRSHQSHQHQSVRLAAALALAEDAKTQRRVQQAIPVGWRNVVSQPQRVTFEQDGEGGTVEEHVVEWHGGRTGYRVDGATVVDVIPAGSAGAWQVTLDVNGLRATYDVAIRGRHVDVDGPSGHVALRVVPLFTDPAEQIAEGSLLAPMPGTVVSVSVAEGAHVTVGQPVLVLEAMKMQHTITAPTDGVVNQLNVAPGSQVTAGEILAHVEEKS